MWHCPHCGAPQAETARCWVCRRSSTTCSTCTHFRRALAGDLGYCGLDARRRPLTGLEQRGCWAPSPAAAAEAEQARSVMAAEPHRLRRGRSPARTAGADGSSPARDFVPIESLTPLARKPIDVADATAAGPSAADPPAFVIDADPDWGERTSLFGDPEG